MKKGLFSNINLTVLQEIEKFNGINPHGINLSHLWVLEQLQEENEVTGLNVIFQFLIRKGYCTESRKITKEGKQIYEAFTTLTSLEETKEKTIQLGKQPTGKGGNKKQLTSFDVWWSTYPSTDEWTDNTGHKWKPTRDFKSRKGDCERLYNQILKTPTYDVTEQDLLDAIAYTVCKKKKETMNLKPAKRENQLRFLVNTYRFLYQKEDLLETIYAAKEWVKESDRKCVEDYEQIINKATRTHGLVNPKDYF